MEVDLLLKSTQFFQDWTSIAKQVSHDKKRDELRNGDGNNKDCSP